jgi:hypothetical protein
MTISGFEGTGKPTATDRSWFQARQELTSHERALLTILDYDGEQDPKVEAYQEKRVYGDELPLADMDEFRKVKAIKARLINYPKTQFEMLLMGMIMMYQNKEE